jgi:hypothetical protein
MGFTPGQQGVMRSSMCLIDARLRVSASRRAVDASRRLLAKVPGPAARPARAAASVRPRQSGLQHWLGLATALLLVLAA